MGSVFCTNSYVRNVYQFVSFFFKDLHNDDLSHRVGFRLLGQIQATF